MRLDDGFYMYLLDCDPRYDYTCEKNQTKREERINNLIVELKNKRENIDFSKRGIEPSVANEFNE